MVSNPEYRKRFVLLSVLVLVAFLPSLMTGFVFDDIPLIVDNPYAQSLVYLKRRFTTDLWDIPSRPDPEQSSLFYRPIISASYLLHWFASRGAAWSFHLVNVLARLGAVWLAFRTAPRWLADVRLGHENLATCIFDPVEHLAGAAPGAFWAGGLIDYPLLLPHSRLDGIVLYPDFVPHVTPGWLDKFLPWRVRPRAHPWLANVLLVAPSRAFLDRLPGRKLPDRNDFYRYGLDHAARIRDWERAIAECERFADAAMAWLARPDPSRVRAL